ncbi:MAG TPA: APC family permease, partial [Candidatus Acidoferrum sp.]|nr:APC family permease [Candidatus Acidoferrum sp.]
MADANHQSLKSAAKKAGIFSFVFVMFSYTTGGPFGLEEQVTTSGPGMTLLYHLLIPLFWCIPISLVAAELTTAMPVQGGFYRWVRAGYGDFWGFLAGWWNWTASFLLGSAYAVLFADYAKVYFPSITNAGHLAICLALIVVIAYVNVRGIELVGHISTVLEIAVLAPVAVMTVMALAHAHHNPFVPL